jgi:predicted TIM-barrel fold metal-dependent hydrolase
MKKFDYHLHHYTGTEILKSREGFKNTFRLADIERGCFLCIPTYHNGDILENLKGLFYKDSLGEGMYSYAGLYYENFNDKSDKKLYAEDFYNQIKSYCENGFDGIKILEGKPSERQKTKTMLSDEVFDKMFAYLEEKQIPFNIHNSDPATFWDKSTMTEVQLKNGWYVGDDMPSKAELFKDVLAVLKKHPNLRLTLAHFGFTTDNIAEAKEFFSYKNTMFDVCPGPEQYENITKNSAEWRAFIVENIDRFKFGTDCANLPPDEDWVENFINVKYGNITRFFETNDEFDFKGYSVKGIALSEDECYKIYYGNALKEHGDPKPINYAWVKSEIEKVKKHALTDKQKHELSVIEEHFSSK